MYFDKGYMLDWIYKRLKALDINSAEIDIFKEAATPLDFIIEPIKGYFNDLKDHIEEGLFQNGFDRDFINQGYFKIHISELGENFGKVSIQCFLISKENRVFAGKKYNEHTYPIAESFFERILEK